MNRPTSKLSARRSGSSSVFALSVDFDGVICDTLSPWEGSHVIRDAPVPGAIEFLRTKLEDPSRWKICIFSCRNWDAGAPKGQEERGIAAMQDWLELHGLDPVLIDRIDFPLTKPIAGVYLDDRARRFEGIFPSDAALREDSVPWNKK